MLDLHLEPFDPRDAATVSSWAPTAADVRAWCSRTEAPVPPDVIASWGAQEDVLAHALRAGLGRIEQGTSTGDLVGYGELWVDDDEAEVELARIVVDPARRGRGLGRALVALLVDRARAHHRRVTLRVVPDNAPARRCYAAAGFVRAAPQDEATWNAGQPTAYVWMLHPGGGPVRHLGSTA